MALPLLELFVKVSTQGMKDVEKDLAKLEKRAKDIEDGPVGRLFGGKDQEKKFKDQQGLLDRFGNKIEEIQKKASKGINLGFDDSKIRENSNSLSKLISDVEKLQNAGKKGINLKLKLDGERDVLQGLEHIEAELDKVKGTVTVRCKLEGNEETIEGLEGIEGIAIRVDDNDVEIDCKLNGDKETFERLSLLHEKVEELDDSDIDLLVKLKGALEASEGLRNLKQDADEVDGRKIDLTTDLKGKEQVLEGLRTIKEKGDELEHDKIQLTMDLRGNEEVVRELSEVEGLAVKIDGNKVTITIDERGGPETIAEMEAVLAKADQIAGKNPTLHVEAKGTAETIAELAAVGAAADKVDGKKVKLDLDNSIIGRLRSISSEMDTLAEKIRNIQTIATGAVFATLIGAVGGLIPVLTAAAAAAGGLANVLGSALVGAATSAGSAIGILAGAVGLLAAPIGLALHGFSDYEKSLQKTSQASSEAKDKAHALEQAQRQLGDAQQGVADAQESAAEKVQAANERYQESVEKVGEAEEQAAERVQAANEKYQESLDKVGEAEEKATERVAQATERYQDSLQKVEDAERKGQDARKQLEDATKSLTQAQEDLNHALRDEPLEQADAELSAKEARLGMAEATQRVTDAQTKLNEAQQKGDPNKVADAEINLQQAQLGTERATLRNQKAENQLSDIRENGSKQLQSATKGVEQASEGQQDALHGIEEADRNTAKAREESGKAFQEISKAELEGQKDVAKARKDSEKAFEGIAKAEIEGQKNVAKAQKDAQKAFEGIAKAQKDGAKQIEQAQRRLEDAEYAVARAMEKMGESSDKSAQKLQNLSEAQKRLFDAIIAFKQEAREAFQPATDAAADLGVKVLALATTFLPQVAAASETAIGGMARAFDTFSMQIREAGPQKAIQDILDSMSRVVEPVTRALGELGIAFLTAFSISLPYGEHLIEVLTRAAHQVYLFTQSAEGIEKISDFFAKTYETAVRVWRVLVDLGAGFANLFKIINETGISEQVLKGLEDMAKNFRDITTEGTDMHDRIKAHLEDLKPVIHALNVLLGKLVNEFFRVSEAVAKAINPDTGNSTLVGVLNAITESLPHVADILINLFTNVGPAIERNLPIFTQFLEVLSQNSDIIADTLNAVGDVLGAFNSLPPDIQSTLIHMIAFFGTFKLLTGIDLPGIAFHFLTMASALQIIEKVSPGATAGLLGFYGQLFLIAAIGAIVIDIAVNYDTEAAAEAKAQAEADGETTGSAFGAGVLAGLKGTTLSGPVVTWLDENVSKPIDKRLGEIEDRYGFLWEQQWRGIIQDSSVGQDVDKWLRDNIEQPIDDFFAGFDPVAEFLASWERLKTNVGGIVSGIVTEFNKLGPGIRTALEQIPIVGWFLGVKRDLLGDPIVVDIVNGIVGEFQRLASALSAPLDAVVGAVTTAFNNISDKILNAPIPTWEASALGRFINTAKDKLGLGGDLPTYEQSALGQLVAKISAATEPVFANSSVAQYLLDLKAAMDDEGIRGAASKLVTDIQSEFEKLKGKASSAWEDVKSAVLGQLADTKKEAVSDSIVPEMVEEIVDAFDGMSGDVEEPMGAFSEAVLGPATELQEQVPASITDMTSQVSGSFDTLSSDSSSKWDTIKTDIGSKVDEISSNSTSKVGTLVSDIGTKWGTLSTDTTSKWETIKTSIGGKVDEIVSNTTSKATELYNGVKQKWDEVYSTSQDVWENVRSFVTDKFNTTTSDVLTAANDLWTQLDSIWSNIRSSAETAWQAVGDALWQPIESGWTKAKGIWNGIVDAIASTLGNILPKDITEKISAAKFEEGGVVRHARGGAYDGMRGGVAKPRNPRAHLWGEGDYAEAYVTADPSHRSENVKYASIAASLVGGQFVPPTQTFATGSAQYGGIQQVWNTTNVVTGGSSGFGSSGSIGSSGSVSRGGSNFQSSGMGSSGGQTTRIPAFKRDGTFEGGPYQTYNIDMDLDAAKEWYTLSKEDQAAFNPGKGKVYGDIGEAEWYQNLAKGWRGYSSDLIEAIYPPGEPPGHVEREQVIQSGGSSGSMGGNFSGSGGGSMSFSSSGGRSFTNNYVSSGSSYTNRVAGYIAGPGSYYGSFSLGKGGAFPVRAFHFGGRTGDWQEYATPLGGPGRNPQPGEPTYWDPNLFGRGLPGYLFESGGTSEMDLPPFGIHDAQITADFMEYLGPDYPLNGGYHAGIDLVGSDSVIHAPAAGTVSDIDTSYISTGLPILVVDYQALDGGTTYSMDYIHTGTPYPGVGDVVRPGQEIGEYALDPEWGGQAHSHQQAYPSPGPRFDYEGIIDPRELYSAVGGNTNAPAGPSGDSGWLRSKVNSALQSIWNSSVQPLLANLQLPSGLGWGGLALNAVLKMAADGLKKTIFKNAPGKGGQVESGAPEYELTDDQRKMIQDGLKYAGNESPSEEDIQGMARLIQRESGWVPDIVNDWDSNAAAGDPTIGLTQMTGQTFDAWKVGPDDDRTDPISAIAAAYRYQMGYYGYLAGADGPYAMGGLATGPTTGIFGEAGDELVLPLQNRAVQQEARDILGTAALEESFGSQMKMWQSQANVQHQSLLRTLRSELGLAPDAAEQLAARTGAHVGGGVDNRLAHNWATQDAQHVARESRDNTRLLRGAW